jgi:hypothetical protein
MPLPAQLQESDLLLFRKLDSGALIDAKCATLSLHSRMVAWMHWTSNPEA